MNTAKENGKRGVAWSLVAMSTFALLIWARQRLVAGLPRTAYAVPEDRPQPKPAVDKVDKDQTTGVPTPLPAIPKQ